MEVLVIGATGCNSGMVVPELKQRGVSVRALVRDSSRVSAALRAGSDTTVVGDLADPASLRAATEGVDGIFHVNPAFAPDEAQMSVAMVAAAKAAGVRKFVFSGVYHPTVSAMVNHAAKQPVEEALYGSGMDFAIMQPAMFMQNLAGLWDTAVRTGRLTMPYSKHARVCYVDYRDVAEAATLALSGDRLSYGTFELAAPGMVDRIDIAALMSTAIGGTVEADESAPQAARPGAGAMERGLARMTAHYDEYGFPGGNGLVLMAILGREPLSLSHFFTEMAAG